jgi:hypothetical protein
VAASGFCSPPVGRRILPTLNREKAGECRVRVWMSLGEAHDGCLRGEVAGWKGNVYGVACAG